MKNAVFLFAFLLSLNTFAQKGTIKGVVKDAKSNEPLIGINVTLQSATTGTTTNEQGEYSLDVNAGEQTIVFSYVGYEDYIEKVVVKSNQVKTLDIQLSENITLLNTVVVSGSRFEKKLSEEIVSMDVIKPIFIERQSISDLGTAIKRNPGVSVIDGQVNIRGGSGWSYGAGSRVLFLLDGYPVLQPSSGGIGLDLPMESVGQIEIIKGAASALYGSSAMNGIVNLRTAYASSEPETTISVFASVNDNPDTKDKYIDAAGNIQSENVDKRWWLQDSVTFKGPSLFGRDTTLKNPYTNRPYSFNISFSNRQKIGKLDLILGGKFGKYSGLTWGIGGTSGRFNIGTRYRFNLKWSAGVNVNMNFGSGGNAFIWSGYRGVNKYLPNGIIIPTVSNFYNASIDPFVNYHDTKGNSHKLLGRFLTSINSNSNNQSNSSHTFYGEYQYQRRIEKISMTISGGMVGAYSFAPSSPLYGNITLSSNNIAVYVQADNKFWKRLNTSVGFRLETNKMTATKREVKPVFRVGVNVEAAKYTFIRASFGQGYRFPTIAERNVLTDLGGFAIVPNPFLKSETGFSAELGIKQGIPFGKRFNAFVDASAFYTQYSNMMEFTSVSTLSGIPIPPNAIVSFASQNVGNTRIYGTEVSLAGEGKFLGKFPTTAVMGYTFVVPQYRNYNEANTDDVVDYNVLKYRFRHTFTAQWDIDFYGFGFGTNLQYFSFVENYDALFDLVGIGLNEYKQTFLKDNAGKFKEKNRYKGNFIWDLRASYTFGKQQKFTFAFLVNNVLNKEYSLRPSVTESNRVYTFRVDMKFK